MLEMCIYAFLSKLGKNAEEENEKKITIWHQ